MATGREPVSVSPWIRKNAYKAIQCVFRHHPTQPPYLAEKSSPEAYQKPSLASQGASLPQSFLPRRWNGATSLPGKTWTAYKPPNSPLVSFSLKWLHGLGLWVFVHPRGLPGRFRRYSGLMAGVFSARRISQVYSVAIIHTLQRSRVYSFEEACEHQSS